MNQLDFTINSTIRKSGKHLTLDERGMIQALHASGKSLRVIAKMIGCAHTTVMYELRRGTPTKKHTKGRKPIYTAKRGQEAYRRHRMNCRKKHKIEHPSCDAFIRLVVEKVCFKKWSFDVCVGHAKLHNLFIPETMISTKTLYNMLHLGKLPISLFDVPLVLRRRPHKPWQRKNKRILGRSIEERPAFINKRSEIGHWEADTVVGHRNGKESVVFTLLERVTRTYIAIKVSGRNRMGTLEALTQLREMYGGKFNQVFKSITADNGPEFENLSMVQAWGTEVYFAHPYSSWERGANERYNGMLRAYIPKGVSVDNYTADDVLHFADMINNRPRRILGYHTSEELFDNFLDKVYAN